MLRPRATYPFFNLPQTSSKRGVIHTSTLSTTRKAAWYILVVSVWLAHVCVYVCQTITFQSLWRRKFIFAHAVYLHRIRVKFVYGHRVKVKVIGAKKVENSYFHNVKLRSAITPVLSAADRMVWLPSLSRDRKCHAYGNYARSRGWSRLKLEGNLVKSNKKDVLNFIAVRYYLYKCSETIVLGLC